MNRRFHPRELSGLEDHQRVLLVLVGLPGSGKTTWCRNHVPDDYAIVSSDDIIEELAAEEGLNYNNGRLKFEGLAVRKAKINFRQAVNTNRNIVLDKTHMKSKRRRGILQNVPAHYYKIAVVFEVDDQEHKERLTRRERETGKWIPPSVIVDMAKSYEPPTRQEGFDVVLFA